MTTYVAYIRVSTTKQGEQGSSLVEQRAAIETYAARHSLTITRWYEEIETAAKQGRRVFNQMLAGLPKRGGVGIIIHKIDRSARNLKDWARLGDLIDRGIDVHFAHESLDLATRGGRLAADIQAVVAADFIRNLRDETRKGFYGRLKQGFYPLNAPYGYRDMGRGKVKEIDPVEGPLVRACFTLYASGRYSLDALRQEMCTRGLKRAGGKPISRNGMSTILRNPFYVGIIRLKTTGEVFEGKHEPLIPRTLFEQVQANLDGRVYARKPSDPFLFRRFVRCAACGLSLIAERQKGHVYYRCHSETCRGTSLRAERIAECVESNLAKLRVDERDLRDVVAALRERAAAERTSDAERIDRHNRDLALLDDRLNKLTDLLIDGTIDRDMFNQRKEALLMQRRGIETERDRKAGSNIEKLISDLELAHMAQPHYEIGNDEERRDLLLELTSNLVVDRKEPVFPMRSPFQEIREINDLQRCDLHQAQPRTSHFSALIHKLIAHLGVRETPQHIPHRDQEHVS
jgi:DNA invertase Pin-like site-specific DNA recombinase